MSDPKVTMVHVRAAKLCSRGLREWLGRYKLDYITFLRGEYPASVIEATGDELGTRVAAIARAEDAAKQAGA